MAFRDDLHDNKDLVVAVIGVLVLSVLTASMFYIEQIEIGPDDDGNVGLNRYDATFEETDFQEVDLGSDSSGTLNEGESTTVDAPVNASNVTAVRATLTWGSSGQQDIDPDEFALEIAGPGEVGCQSRTSGSAMTLDRSCEGVSIPEDEKLRAENKSAAEREIAKIVPPDDNATGTYTVTIELVDSGDDSAVDDSNSYTLTVEYKTYEPTITEATLPD